MDRTEEMMELVTRMVTILMEERSRMCREIERLNLALEKLQDSISSLQPVSEPQVSRMEPQVIEMPDISLDESDFSFEPEPEPEPEPESESESEPEPEPESSPVIEPFENHEPELEFVYEPESEPESESESESESELESEPDSGVLRPRDREEQINDKSEWGMFFDSHIADASDVQEDESVIGNLMDFQEEPAEPAWMTDFPGLHVDSVYDALTNSDRILFIRELFDEDGEQFTLSMDRIDECPDFGQVVKEMRVAFPEWDESSDVVYQFYMLVRKRFV